MCSSKRKPKLISDKNCIYNEEGITKISTIYSVSLSIFIVELDTVKINSK